MAQRQTSNIATRSALMPLALAMALPLALVACSGGTDTDTDANSDANASSRTAATAAADSANANDPAASANASGVPAGGVIVRVNGPSASRYPVGTSFAAGSIITLAEGDQIVLLNDDGTRTLTGPASFTAGSFGETTSEGDARGQTLGRIAGNVGEDNSRSSIAAARMPVRPPDADSSGTRIDTAARYAAALFDAEGRSAAAATRRTIAPPGMARDLAALPEGPGLWTYALGSSGTHCLPALNDLVVARRGGGEALAISVAPVAGPGAGGAPRNLTLGAGRSSVGWIGNWLNAGTRYRIAVDGGVGAGGAGAGGPSGDVRFVAIGAPPADPAALARTLSAYGCTAQVQRLARMMGTPGMARDDIAIPGRRAVAPPRTVPGVTTVRPDVVRPDGVRPDAVRGDVARPDVGRPDGVRPDVIVRPGPRIIVPRPNPRLDPRVVPDQPVAAPTADVAAPIRPRASVGRPALPPAQPVAPRVVGEVRGEP